MFTSYRQMLWVGKNENIYEIQVNDRKAPYDPKFPC